MPGSWSNTVRTYRVPLHSTPKTCQPVWSDIVLLWGKYKLCPAVRRWCLMDSMFRMLSTTICYSNWENILQTQPIDVVELSSRCHVGNVRHAILSKFPEFGYQFFFPGAIPEVLTNITIQTNSNWKSYLRVERLYKPEHIYPRNVSLAAHQRKAPIP